MSIRVLVSCCVITAASLAGCGDSPEAGDATEECENLISTYCGRVNECSINVSYDECDTQVRTEINCGRAADTSDDYDRCLEEIQGSTCDGLFGAAVSLPASCKGAILVAD